MNTKSKKVNAARATKGTKRARRTKQAPEYVQAGMVRFRPDRYAEHKNKRTASGRPVYDTGDKVASILRGKTLDEQYAAAAKVLDQSAKSLRKQYEHLNPGQQRMAIGNRMRGAMN